MTTFLYSFRSEWLKRKRTAASWLVVLGGFFIPTILFFARFNDIKAIGSLNASDHLWTTLFGRAWQFMALFLLPMGVILATSLITQLEFRNNSWKQLHTSPQKFSTIFSAKLSVVLVMLLQFFVLFNIGIYVAGVLPALFVSSASYPKQPFTLDLLWSVNSNYLLYCLPIVAFQFLISLQFRNFLIPIGIGVGLLVASLIALNWKYGYIVPYTYCGYGFLSSNGLKPTVSIGYWAAGYTVGFLLLAYVLYLVKKEK